MFGIALALCDLSESLIHQHQLQARICRRRENADDEVHFLDCQRPRLLPVWLDGQLLILPWGRESLWCPVEALKAGHWEHRESVEAIIPASFAQDRGVWYLIEEGIRAVVVKVRHQRFVFPISQTSNHYYLIMTRNPRMPVLAGTSL